jgi:hypothetical protein
MAVTVDGLPARALADEPFTVVLTGLTPRSDVTIKVRLDNCLGRAWRGTFCANADAAGVLDLATAALTGFAEPDPTALLWAVEPDGKPDPAAANAEDTRGALTVLEGERAVAVHEFARVFRDRGVTCTELAGPVVGALYLPAGPGPHPAVMTVSGSGGGIARAEAALLASRGFACLALAYFNYPGRPPELIDQPLEYFGQALDWLAAQPQVRAGRSRSRAILAAGSSACCWAPPSRQCGLWWPSRPAGTSGARPLPIGLTRLPGRGKARHCGRCRRQRARKLTRAGTSRPMARFA